MRVRLTRTLTQNPNTNQADAPLTLAAVGALRHLVGTPAGSAALTGAGVEPLVRLLQPGTPEDAQAHAG